MRSIILVIFFGTLLFADTINKSTDNRKEFLTQYEYGRALYNNPRGIGCNECHGNNGEGAIVSYIKSKPIIAPKITNMDFRRFEAALRSGKGIMPKYNITARELVALYAFLNPNFKLPDDIQDNN